jgi:hypothetical protein
MLTASEQEQFRRLCTILGSFFHHEYRERLEALKDAYAPFDPDRDTLDVQPVSESQRQQRLESLFQEFDGLLQRANFIRLDHDRIVQATQSVSAWGINLDVDFNCFDRMEIYVRGERNGIRPLRIWYKPWAIREERVRQYQRLVLILKQRPHRRLGRNADTKSVLLKLFKDIPTDDLEMLLPGGRVKMPKFERGKLGASLLSAVGFAGFKIYNDVLQVSATFFQQNPLSLYGPLSIVLGYGYKQYYAFQTSRQHYSHRLTESLYYQNLDSNGGVLYRLLDEGEEQDCREAYLAYYHLWRNAPADGWTTAQLDDYIEIELERTLNLKFDFEVDDAIAKLERLNLVVKSGDRYRSVPIDEALRRIDEIWDNIFPYNQ